MKAQEKIDLLRKAINAMQEHQGKPGFQRAFRDAIRAANMTAPSLMTMDERIAAAKVSIPGDCRPTGLGSYVRRVKEPPAEKLSSTPRLGRLLRDLVNEAKADV